VASPKEPPASTRERQILAHRFGDMITLGRAASFNAFEAPTEAIRAK